MVMNEVQAERIINPLESIDSTLTDIQSDTTWIQLHASNIETNTTD